MKIGTFNIGEKHGISEFHDVNEGKIFEERWEYGELIERKLILSEQDDEYADGN